MEMLRQKIRSMVGRIKRELRVGKVRIMFFEDEEGQLCVHFVVQRYDGQQFYFEAVLDRDSAREGFLIDRAIEHLRSTMIANREVMKNG